MVDLARRTGKLTRLLVPSGARVIAVEPLAEMRAVLDAVAPGAEVLDGTAESMPLADASVDAVTVAQAFHWFDARPRCRDRASGAARRRGGARLERRAISPTSVQARFQELLLPYRGDTPNEHERPWLADVAASPSFGPIEEWSVPWVEQTHAAPSWRAGSGR